VYAVVVCALIAPRFIVSPPDVQVPEKQRAAQPSDGQDPAAATSRNDDGGRAHHDHLILFDIKDANVPVITSNVGAETTGTAFGGSDPAQPPKKIADAAHEKLSPSQAPGKDIPPLLGNNKIELLPEAGPALAGHVISISQDAGSDSKSEAAVAVQQTAPPEGKPEQPPKVCTQMPQSCKVLVSPRSHSPRLSLQVAFARYLTRLLQARVPQNSPVRQLQQSATFLHWQRMASNL
jgi:hypothetical protein